MQLDPTTDESFRAFLPGMPQEDDRALIVTFFTEKKLLGAKSIAAGREIYEDREYVKIQIKGQDKQVVVEEVKAYHKQKYPIAYQQFVLRKPAPVVGTPIEQLPGMGPTQAHHLKGLNLRSIEDLANVSDENTINAIGMGARDLVKRAKAWIEQKAPQTIELAEQLAAEKAERERVEQERAAERRAFEERLAALEKVKAPAKKRRRKAKRRGVAMKTAQTADGAQA